MGVPVFAEDARGDSAPSGLCTGASAGFLIKPPSSSTSLFPLSQDDSKSHNCSGGPHVTHRRRSCLASHHLQAECREYSNCGLAFPDDGHEAQSGRAASVSEKSNSSADRSPEVMTVTQALRCCRGGVNEPTRAQKPRQSLEPRSLLGASWLGLEGSCHLGEQELSRARMGWGRKSIPGRRNSMCRSLRVRRIWGVGARAPHSESITSPLPPA